MSTTTMARPAVVDRPAKRVDPIPFARVAGVELRKMFDTRSGFWLMIGIAVAAVLATGSMVAFAPDSALTYSNFAAAIGLPMSVLLPVVAILSVTSEHSQRTGLTTYTLVPHRGRVLLAKALCAIAVGVVSIGVAAAVGALGHLIGTSIAGVPTTWDVSALTLAEIVLGNVLGLMVGFMLGVLVRSSAAAIVGYFVYAFVVPTISELLAATQDWYRSAQPWVDFNYAISPLFDGDVTATEWAHLAGSGTVWLVLPLALGTWLSLRSEVK